MNSTVVYFLPVITAFVAWILCRAGTSLFLKKLYQRRSTLIHSLLTSFAGDLLDTTAITKKLADPANLASVKPLIETHVNTFLNIKLQEKLPVIAMFASPDMLGKIKEGLLEEIDLLLPEVMEQYAGTLVTNAKPIDRIVQKATAMPESETLNEVRKSFRAAFFYVEMAAVFLGLIIGTVPLIATLF